MGTGDKLALVRDPFACKPAVVAETDDYVAIASEFRSLAHLPGVRDAERVRAEAGGGVLMGGVSAQMLEDAEGVRSAQRAACGRPISFCTAISRASRHVRIENPDGAHSIAVGLNAPVRVEILGHAGYYAAGMNQHAHVVVHGNAGPGVAENMMSGTRRGARLRERRRRRIGARRAAHHSWRCRPSLRHFAQGRGHRRRRRRRQLLRLHGAGGAHARLRQRWRWARRFAV